jgi:hypothetical protein
VLCEVADDGIEAMHRLGWLLRLEARTGEGERSHVPTDSLKTLVPASKHDDICLSQANVGLF